MDGDSLRAKIILLLGGSLFGVVFGFAFYKAVIWYRGETVIPEGASFESVEDFRRAMLGRDDRDVHSDKSVSFRSIITPDESDRIIYRLKPNLDVVFEEAPVRTNSFGMRGPEISIEKPPGTYRIAIIGDSFTFGWGVEVEKSFVQVTERSLNASLSGKQKIEVLNFGVPGYSTFQEAALLESLGAQFKPDAVVVYFIENDFGLPFFIKNFAKDGVLVNNSHFHDLKDESEDTEAELGHVELQRNLDANRALRKLAEYCTEKGMKLFLVVNPGKNFEKTVKRLQRSRDVPNLTYITIREEVKAEIAAKGLTSSQLQLPRDPHPSAIKHAILGEALAAKLLPFIPVGSSVDAR